jgi:hypothetical protein
LRGNGGQRGGRLAGDSGADHDDVAVDSGRAGAGCFRSFRTIRWKAGRS